MKRLSGLMALAVLLSFGTLTYAGDPAPADGKEKKESVGGKLVYAGDEKKEEKKGDKGGKLIFADDEKKKEEKKGGK